MTEQIYFASRQLLLTESGVKTKDSGGIIPWRQIFRVERERRSSDWILSYYNEKGKKRGVTLYCQKEETEPVLQILQEHMPRMEQSRRKCSVEDAVGVWLGIYICSLLIVAVVVFLGRPESMSTTLAGLPFALLAQAVPENADVGNLLTFAVRFGILMAACAGISYLRSDRIVYELPQQ